MEIIKKVNKVLFIVVLMFLLSISTNAKAAESPTAPDNFGKPIEVNVYEEDDGSIVTEKIYFVPDEDSDGLSLYSSNFKGWYKNEKEHTWGGGTVMKYYAQGYFAWGDGKVSVSSPSGGVSNVPSSVTILNKKTNSGTGKYTDVYGVSRNFAYVNFSFIARMNVGFDKDLSVSIKINDIGEKI